MTSTHTKEDRGDILKKIEETDDLKLKMMAALEKPEPEDALYPPELNAHLIEQLRVGLFYFKLVYTCRIQSDPYAFHPSLGR